MPVTKDDTQPTLSRTTQKHTNSIPPSRNTTRKIRIARSRRHVRFNFIDQQWRLPHTKTDEQRTRPFNKREAKAALNANAAQGLTTTPYNTATEFPGSMGNCGRRPRKTTPICGYYDWAENRCEMMIEQLRRCCWLVVWRHCKARWLGLRRV